MIRHECPLRASSHVPRKTGELEKKFLTEFWEEGAYYEFSPQQIIEHIIPAAEEVEWMCRRLLPNLLHDEEYMDNLFIPDQMRDFIRQSYSQRNTSVIGRMDFGYDGVTPPRLLEYNADTSAILYETGYYQGQWLNDLITLGHFTTETTQFNILQDNLIMALHAKKNILNPLHISCCKDAPEDRMTTAYFENCAQIAGINSHFVHYEDITTAATGELYDHQGRQIKSLYRFYPWEWSFEEDKFFQILTNNQTSFIEPPWKLLLSNKLLLTKLWDKFKDHPNLLPAYQEENPEADKIWHDCVRKPVYSREGDNIQVISNGTVLDAREGTYTDSGYIIQKRYHIPSYKDKYPIIAVWLVGGIPSALGILEQNGSTITDNSSKFVPHIIQNPES